jgi:hypothetical protein
MYNKRKYIILYTSEIDKINFDEVLETDSNSLRKSLDNSLTFIKYENDSSPSFIASLSWSDGPFSHSEMLEILEKPIWSRQYDISG